MLTCSVFIHYVCRLLAAPTVFPFHTNKPLSLLEEIYLCRNDVALR